MQDAFGLKITLRGQRTNTSNDFSKYNQRLALGKNDFNGSDFCRCINEFMTLLRERNWRNYEYERIKKQGVKSW